MIPTFPRFVAAHCDIGRPPLVPELRINLARDAVGIFEAAGEIPRRGEIMPPYWAFAWPGGQALARWILDQPAEVAGRHVVDIGAGSGISSIAAAIAGARHVLAVDIDPLATLAIAINAKVNDVVLETTSADVLGALPDADLVLLGDLVYEPAMETRVAGLIEDAVRRDMEVLVADRTNAKRLRIAGGSGRGGRRAFAPEFLGDYEAPLTPALEGHPFERARLWRIRRAETRSERA